MRIVLLMMVLVLTFYASADAGWLDDKLKKAAESIGDRMVDDAADSAYEGTKDAITPDNDTQNENSRRYRAEEAAEYEEQVDEPEKYSGEYLDESQLEEMEEPSWADYGYGQQRRKKKKAGPPRTDLYLTTDMIMSSPESSPEPIKGNIYIDGPRMRTEWKYPGNDIGMIVTGVEPTDKVYVLMHSEQTYIESSYDETDYFSFESGKPCNGYRKAEDLGKTKLNGRRVATWRCSEPEDAEDAKEARNTITLWVDDKLDIPIKMEEGNGEGHWEMMNIREGKPPGNLFKVPTGYKKLAVGAIPTANSLPGQDEKLIKNAGIPLYSKARFVYGNSSVGYRYASSEPVEKVRKWYRKKLSSWPIYEDKFDSWIIYKGKPGADMSQLMMQKTQVSVQENNKLPEWHTLDKDMTTEILIFIVE